MSVPYYRGLLAQSARIEAFRRAIEATVRPGDRVLDLGTGLGTYAFFAARAGAARVYAVDGEPIVHVARAVAEANGLRDRVEFFRGRIPDLALPTPVDVVVFEDFPTRLLEPRVFLLYRDLHRGILAPDARAVPAGARVFLAPVRSPRIARLIAPLGMSERAYDIDWRPSREYAAAAPQQVDVGPAELAAPPAPVVDLALDAPLPAGGLTGSGSWTLEVGGPVHALLLWFDLELAPGIVLSNAPGAEPRSWGQLLLPLDPPLDVDAGAVLRGAIETPPGTGGTPGWLGWHASAGGRTVRGNEFAAIPAALDDLLALSPDGRPTLTSRGAREARALELVDGRRSTGEIARLLRTLYPALSDAEALHAVADALHGRARALAPNGGRRP